MNMRRSLIVGALMVLVASACVALVLARPRRSGSTDAHTHAPVYVTEVPKTLQASGVFINNQVVLQPMAAPPKSAMTAAQAVRAARAYGSHPWSPPPVALEARFTVPSSIPPPGISAAERKRSVVIANVPAWVVTYSFPTTTGVTHASVVLDATTGKWVIGFVTH